MHHPNILYLDIDGVLNSKESRNHKNYGPPKSEEEKFVQEISADAHADYALSWFRAIEEAKISVLNEILQEIDLKIVISSDWRVWGLDMCRSFLYNKGLCGEIVDALPKKGGKKSTSIASYNINHFVSKCIIIDDAFMPENLRRFHIRTHPDLGLLKKHIKKARKVFDAQSELRL